MGAVRFFSADSRDFRREQPILRSDFEEPKWQPINSTPDPTNFEVQRHIIVNGYPIYIVKYPGVQNYEGVKILMYPKNFNMEILADRMDPHFFDKGDSPIARFEPTDFGWHAAMTLASNLP